jgi:predicted amidophosphoribosyltransferase
MRDRHFPRLCRSCRQPMARQEDTCWHCGAPWVTEEQPPTMRPLPVRTPLTIAGR